MTTRAKDKKESKWIWEGKDGDNFQDILSNIIVIVELATCPRGKRRREKKMKSAMVP